MYLGLVTLHSNMCLVEVIEYSMKLKIPQNILGTMSTIVILNLVNLVLAAHGESNVQPAWESSQSHAVLTRAHLYVWSLMHGSWLYRQVGHMLYSVVSEIQ